MQKDFNFLKGYKTYLVGAATALYGIVAHHQSLNTLAPYLFSGLGLLALRAAVAKVEQVVAAVELKVNAVVRTLPPVEQAVVAPIVATAEDDIAAVEAKVDKKLGN